MVASTTIDLVISNMYGVVGFDVDLPKITDHKAQLVSINNEKPEVKIKIKMIRKTSEEQIMQIMFELVKGDSLSGITENNIADCIKKLLLNYDLNPGPRLFYQADALPTEL